MRPFLIRLLRNVPCTVSLLSMVAHTADAQRPPRDGFFLDPGRLTVTFGVEAGDPREQVGAVTDAAVGPQEHIFILDAPLGRVLAIDSHGGFLSSFGRPGAGPGEFRNPVALAFLQGLQKLLVLDQAQGRVSFLAWRGDRLEYTTSFAVTPYSVDMCAMNGEIFIYAPSLSEETVIQVFDVSGHRKRTFGAPFGSEGGAMMRMAKRGASLACYPQRSSVVVASQLDGEVRAYSTDGALLWTSRGRELITAKIRLSATSFGFDRDTPQPWDLVDILVPIDADALAVQFERAKRPPSAGEDRGASRITVFLSAATGAELARVSSLPRILAVDGQRLLASHDFPYPQLQVFAPVIVRP